MYRRNWLAKKGNKRNAILHSREYLAVLTAFIPQKDVNNKKKQPMRQPPTLFSNERIPYYVKYIKIKKGGNYYYG